MKTELPGPWHWSELSVHWRWQTQPDRASEETLGVWQWRSGGQQWGRMLTAPGHQRGRMPFLLVWGSKAYCQKSPSHQRPKAEEETHPSGKKELVTNRLLILKKMMGSRGQREISFGNRSRGTSTGNREGLCPRIFIKEMAYSSQQIWADTMVTRKKTTSVSDGPKGCVKICLCPKLQGPNPCPGWYGPAEGQRFNFSYNNQQRCLESL